MCARQSVCLCVPLRSPRAWHLCQCSGYQRFVGTPENSREKKSPQNGREKIIGSTIIWGKNYQFPAQMFSGARHSATSRMYVNMDKLKYASHPHSQHTSKTVKKIIESSESGEAPKESMCVGGVPCHDLSPREC